MAVGATPHVGNGPPVSLDQLLVRSGRGDRTAFAELFDRIAPGVFGLVRSLVQDVATAERITGEVFLETWRRAATYDPAHAGALAWTLVITRRLAVPASRLVPRATASGDAGHRPFLLACGLTPHQADALHLAWFDGLDHRQIGTAMGIDVPVTRLLTGALEALVPIGAR